MQDFVEDQMPHKKKAKKKHIKKADHKHDEECSHRRRSRLGAIVLYAGKSANSISHGPLSLFHCGQVGILGRMSVQKKPKES